MVTSFGWLTFPHKYRKTPDRVCKDPQGWISEYPQSRWAKLQPQEGRWCAEQRFWMHVSVKKTILYFGFGCKPGAYQDFKGLENFPRLLGCEQLKLGHAKYDNFHHILEKKNYDLEVEGKVGAQNIHIHTISQLGFNDKVSRGTQPLMSSVIYSKNDL